jgi:hypothetical protein
MMEALPKQKSVWMLLPAQSGDNGVGKLGCGTGIRIYTNKNRLGLKGHTNIACIAFTSTNEVASHYVFPKPNDFVQKSEKNDVGAKVGQPRTHRSLSR